MTSQQQADYLLGIWQQSRALSPIDRLEMLMADFFSPLPPSLPEYEADLEVIRQCMERA